MKPRPLCTSKFQPRVQDVVVGIMVHSKEALNNVVQETRATSLEFW